MKFFVTATARDAETAPDGRIKSSLSYDGIVLEKWDEHAQWLAGVYSIEINTLDDLMAFQKKVDCPLIINPKSDSEPTIEIYNDYRE